MNSSPGIAILRIEFYSAFEVSLGSSIVPLIPLLFNGQCNVRFDIRLIEPKGFPRCLPRSRSGNLRVDIPIILVDVLYASWL
jgi:hypothetical protein